MPLLNEQIRSDVKNLLGDLPAPVSIKFFSQESECEYCDDTQQLVTEVAELSDQISVELFDFQRDADAVRQYGIDKVPAMAITGERDYGIRMFGIPSGYEFGSLIEGIKLVSEGHAELSKPTQDLLAKLKEPVHMQVFITPT